MSNLQSILVTVIAGIAIAYLAYRRFPKDKRADTRSELRTQQESFRAAAESLAATLDMARRTRTAAAEEAGHCRSEALQRFFDEWDADWLEANQLALQVPAADTDYGALSDTDVDIRLLEILALSLRAHSLVDKYRASSAAADEDCGEPPYDSRATARSLPGAHATIRDHAIELVQSSSFSA
jgi:hypothetical protein